MMLVVNSKSKSSDTTNNFQLKKQPENELVVQVSCLRIFIPTRPS